jgi:hypothetical protein
VHPDGFTANGNPIGQDPVPKDEFELAGVNKTLAVSVY